METSDNAVKIFTIPQRFPCGPRSSCCGPIGQTEEEIGALKDIIEKELHCQVDVIDATNGNAMRDHRPIVDVIRAFGLTSLPIVTCNGEVASLGQAPPEEAVLAIKEKMDKN